MAGRITTHVLDIAAGRPATGMTIELWRLDVDQGARQRLRTVRTNADGRTDTPMLADDAMVAGVYELVFAVGDYFARDGRETVHPPFLSQVPIRFGVADPDAHYHVPLLTSAWAYSTYRGS